MYLVLDLKYRHAVGRVLVSKVVDFAATSITCINVDKVFFGVLQS